MKYKLSAMVGALVLAMAVSTTTLAASDRSSQIKSQGVFEFKDQNNRLAIFDSSDLRSLAVEVDTLESYYKQYAKDQYAKGYADGVSKGGSYNIKYTYHSHVRSGCRSSEYKCTGYYDIFVESEKGASESGGTRYWYKCSTCGHINHVGKDGGYPCQNTYTMWNCGKDESTIESVQINFY